MLETTIGELFDKAIKHFENHVAVKDINRGVTYAELGEEVNRFANALLQLGIQSGDRVALWEKNSIEYIVSDLAIAKIGAIRVPLNQFLSEPEVAYRIDDSDVTAVVSGAEFLPALQNALQCTTVNPYIISVNGQIGYDFHTLVKNASARSPQVMAKHEDLTAIVYSGGTTGRSKGIMHTHKSLISLMYSEIVECELERGVVMLHVAPLPHASGFLILPGLLRGGTHILHQGFDAQSFCETVEQEKVTCTFLVPTMIYMVLDALGLNEHDFSSLKTIIYGAAPIAPSRVKQALEAWGPILIQVYSQLEVSMQTTVLTKSDHLIPEGEDERRLASCGRSIILSQVRIVDDEGDEVLPGEVGEIVTRGPHLMTGYWKKYKETTEAIQNGWLHTGDMAYEDESGYLYLMDRKKDMIISGGFNVYSAVVEKVLFEHPAVRQAAVIGIPDDKWGEAVKAIVVVDSEVAFSSCELIQFCKSKLAKYEVPKSIEYVEMLPFTPYGKVDKKALRASYVAK